MRVYLITPLAFDTSIFFHAIRAVENLGGSGSPWVLDGIPLDIMSITYISTTRLPLNLLLSKLGVIIILSEDCRSPLIDFLELNGSTISRQPNPWLIASIDGPIRLRLTHLKCHSFGLVRERDTLRVLFRMLLSRVENIVLRPQPEILPPLAYFLSVEYLRREDDQNRLALKLERISRFLIDRLRDWLQTREDIPMDLLSRIRMIMQPFWPEDRWRLERVTTSLFHLQLEKINSEIDRALVSLLERVILELISPLICHSPSKKDNDDEVEGNVRRVRVIWSVESVCIVIRLKAGAGLGCSNPQTPSMPQ